ncbi:MAG: Hsp70 family protein, partial [bacterium]
HADGMIHATEKSLKELADQVGDEEKTSIEHAIEALKEAVKGDDKDAIEAKTNDLTELSGKLAERVYAQKAGAEGGEAHHDSGSSHHHEADDSVVDAEFEEVKKD